MCDLYVSISWSMGRGDQRLIRQLAIVKMEGMPKIPTCQTSFLPGLEWDKLSSKEKRANLYLADKGHGLYWSDGNLRQDEVRTILRLHVHPYDRVISKGSEASSLLYELLDEKNIVFNLEEECSPPRVTDMGVAHNDACKFRHRPEHCAVTKAVFFARWCLENAIEFKQELP